MKTETVYPSEVDYKRNSVKMHMKHFTSVKEIPASIWNRFVRHETVGLELAHLQAVEVSRINDIHPYYIIGYREEKPVGIAYCFSIRVDLARMANSYPAEVVETVKSWNLTSWK